MNRIVASTVLAAAVCAAGGIVFADDLSLADPANLPSPPVNSPGFPTRSPTLDALPGFANPPAGFGEVPYWWWSGEKLDKERLLWQLDQLHAKGISGVQINYCHDVRMVTYPSDPPIFSDAWWEIWKWMTAECKKRNMGIGLSGYTLDWAGRDNLFRKLGITDGSLAGSSLQQQTFRPPAGKPFAKPLTGTPVAIRAFQCRSDGSLLPGSDIDLAAHVVNGTLTWTPPDGSWQIVSIAAVKRAFSLDPMDPAAGARVIERFFQPFADNSPGQASSALNYFFQDELGFGVGGWMWNDRFAAEFQKRKGYDLAPLLPALFSDIGPQTPKLRLDYYDVMVSLSEENYFKPIFDWHWKRGMIYACDPSSRGRNPIEFGDYFRTVRWYSAPGHDTPGGSADLVKDKVSSSIAHLYQRPRVWLEGYHSLGWGATPATIFDSSNKNFLYGASLLNLHGLYYTTYGGYWEWAPPCFHFRMPYWDHMGSFLKYFERLSYVLSEGVHACDVAVLYPTSPLQADLGGKQASTTAFAAASELFIKNGLDFDYIDDQSVARAKIADKQLQVSGESYRVLVLPDMRAIRQTTIQQALNFYRAGGIVVAIGALPEASDAAGAADPKLNAMVQEIFGITSTAPTTTAARTQSNPAGGRGLVIKQAADLAGALAQTFPRDFQGPAQVLHRKLGPRDLYMVMGAPKTTDCFFRAKGAVELWDPWTGTTTPIFNFTPVADGTRVRLPLDVTEANLIVFTPGNPGASVSRTDLDDITTITSANGKVSLAGYANTGGTKFADVRVGDKTSQIAGEAANPPAPITLDGDWEFQLSPTLDNRWGDYRLPAFNAKIGAEARRFHYAPETTANFQGQTPTLDDSRWPLATYSFGPKFWKLGPLPDNLDTAALEAQLAKLTQINPAIPVEAAGKTFPWQPFDFSWQWGVEGDTGDQDGHHGLKERLTDQFIALGKETPAGGSVQHFVRTKEPGGSRYYLWTSVTSPQAATANILAGGLKPASAWINQTAYKTLPASVSLDAGANPLLLRFDAPGRASVVFEKSDAPQDWKQTHPLAMRWYNKPGVLPYDTRPESISPAGWYRFNSAPGLQTMTITAYGTVQAWVDGKPARITTGQTRPDGAIIYTAQVETPSPDCVPVAIRIEQARGCYGGAAMPEPVAMNCAPGKLPAGDWSRLDGLASYSGGAWYRKNLSLTPAQLTGRVILDLGKVAATAEVRINGKPAGIKVTPPWRLNITSFLQAGDNRVEILVYNTLANQYLTIPTQYRGSPISGLLGPVTVNFASPVTLRSEP